MTDQWTGLLEHESYTDIAGTQTHYFDVGEGKPVFLIHGGGLTSSAEQNWGAVIQPLSEECRVIAVDQPGFGFTDLRDEEDYKVRHRAEFLIDVIEQFDLPPVTLAGNSEGLFGTIYIALTRPDLVENVIIVNSRTPRPEEPSGDLFAPEPEREGLREKIEEVREQRYVTYEHHPFYRDPITEGKVDRYYELKERNWEHNQARAELYASDGYTSEYDGQVIDYSAPELDVPALITWSTTPEVFPRVHYRDNEELAGEIEEYFGDMDPVEPALWFVEEMDDAELHLWDEGKHHVMTDHAPRWVDVVTDFVYA